jgi:hypothetical protein
MTSVTEILAQSPAVDTKVLHTKESAPNYGFRPSRRPVPEYHNKYSTPEGARSQRQQSSRINFGADTNRAGARSENVGSHVYHDKTQQASFSMTTTPMMFSETYRPGRRAYGDRASNPIINDGIPAEVPNAARRRLESGPSPELQRMNEKMWKLPADRDAIHSPRRPVRSEADVAVKAVGKRVHGTAKRAPQIQMCFGTAPTDQQVRVETATPESSQTAFFKQMCSETQQAVQERRLWGQIFRARGQDSLRLS